MPDLSSGFVPGRHVITAYGRGGFRFADMSHVGSIIALPSGVHAWSALAPADITEASLAPLFAAPEGVELLLLGTGVDLVPPSPGLRARLKAIGVSVDPMPSGAAARTYNILLDEQRRVAAAILAVP